MAARAVRAVTVANHWPVGPQIKRNVFTVYVLLSCPVHSVSGSQPNRSEGALAAHITRCKARIHWVYLRHAAIFDQRPHFARVNRLHSELMRKPWLPIVAHGHFVRFVYLSGQCER